MVVDGGVDGVVVDGGVDGVVVDGGVVEDEPASPSEPVGTPLPVVGVDISFAIVYILLILVYLKFLKRVSSPASCDPRKP